MADSITQFIEWIQIHQWKSLFTACSIFVVAIYSIYRKKQSLKKKIEKDLYGIDVHQFKPLSYLQIYKENKHNLIKVDNYNSGGILDTQNLKVLDKSFKNPYIRNNTLFESYGSINTKLNKQINNIMIFYNPLSGNKKSNYIINDIILKLLKDKKYCNAIKKYIVIKSEKPKHITQYLINNDNKLNIMKKHKIDLFIVCGGDGTFNEFVNGYVIGQYYINHKIPILFIPGGSNNSFCMQLSYGLKLKLVSNLDIIHKSFKHLLELNNDKKLNLLPSQQIDILKIKNKKNTKYAINHCVFGVSSNIVQMSEKLRGGLLNQYRDNIAKLIALLHKKTFKYRLIIHFDDENSYQFDTELIILFCQKVKYISNHIPVPFCKSNNGFMDVCLVPNMSRITLVKSLVTDFPFGKHILNTKQTQAIFFRCKSMEIVHFKGCDNATIIDGDLAQSTPHNITVLPNILPIVAVNYSMYM